MTMVVFAVVTSSTEDSLGKKSYSISNEFYNVESHLFLTIFLFKKHFFSLKKNSLLGNDFLTKKKNPTKKKVLLENNFLSYEFSESPNASQRTYLLTIIVKKRACPPP
jgi:TRAP-type mannitol/chloroaromatic compound transport system permease small subunit